MRNLRRDASYALRTWRRQPGPIAAAIVTLALGIAATATIFSVVSGVLLKPLPYADPDRLVMIWQDLRARGGPERDWVSPGLFNEWRRRATMFEQLAAIRGWNPNLTGDGEPERLRGAAVSYGYFAGLGIPAALGHAFTEAEDRPGGEPIAVLAHPLWVRRFGRDPAIVGRTILLDGLSTTVVGVMPQGFEPPLIEADVWSPIRIDPVSAPRGIVNLRTFGKLKDGIDLAQAQAGINTIAVQLAEEDPEWDRARTALIPLHEDIVGSVKPVLIVLSVAVALVLAIACTNVASLLLARASERTRELMIRAALGAGRRHLVMQVVVDTLLLAGAGGALGLLMAYWGVQALLGIAPPSAPRLQDVHLDATVLLFTAVVTLISALACGLAPALASTGIELSPALREGGRESTGATKLRSVLVAIEVAVAMVLVINAALVVQSLVALQRVDLGFRTDRVLTASLAPPRGTYRGEDAVRGLYDRILDRASALPGVEAAALTSVLPLSGMNMNLTFQIEGRPPARSLAEEPAGWFRVVSPSYFTTIGVRLIAGRGISADDRADAPGAIVVNESLARKYWPDRSALGQRVRIQALEATVIGVVADVRHRGPAQPPDPEMYLPYAQFSTRNAWLVVRTRGDAAGAATALRAAVRDVDPGLPLANLATLEGLAARSVAQPRFIAALLSAFSALAAILALVGVYGVLSYSVSRRVREIGVRIALGAERRAVVRMILVQSLTFAGAGILIGAGVAAVVSRLLRTLLFGVPPGDPATLAAMAAALTAAALAASYVPARRASRIDPIAALREE